MAKIIKMMDLLKKEDIELQNEASSVNIGKNTEFYQGFSSKEAKKVMDDAIRNYAKELRKVQYKVIKDWLSKAKSGTSIMFGVKNFLLKIGSSIPKLFTLNESKSFHSTKCILSLDFTTGNNVLIFLLLITSNKRRTSTS